MIKKVLQKGWIKNKIFLITFLSLKFCSVYLFMAAIYEIILVQHKDPLNFVQS